MSYDYFFFAFSHPSTSHITFYSFSVPTNPVLRVVLKYSSIKLAMLLVIFKEENLVEFNQQMHVLLSCIKLPVSSFNGLLQRVSEDYHNFYKCIWMLLPINTWNEKRDVQGSSRGLACQYCCGCYLELSSHSRLLDCFCQLDLFSYYFPLAKGTECRKSLSEDSGRSLGVYHYSEDQAGQMYCLF